MREAAIQSRGGNAGGLPDVPRRTTADVEAAYTARDRVAGVWAEHGAQVHHEDDPYCTCDDCMHAFSP